MEFLFHVIKLIPQRKAVKVALFPDIDLLYETSCIKKSEVK